jgi:two-component system OmpR family sensor kinase
MLNSVRIRLTIWYAAVMTMVLVALAAMTFVLLRQNLVRRIDGNATELADSFLATVKAELQDGSSPDAIPHGIAAAISEHQFRDVIYVVFDSQSQLLGTSEGAPQPSSDLSRDTLARSLRPFVSAPDAFRFVRIGERPYRGYMRHFSLSDREATLVVLQSLHPQNEFLETLARIFGIVIPLAILVSGAGGYLMARRSLSPVVVMSTQASRIGADNLHERLRVQNPGDELGGLAASFNELLDRVSRSIERQRRFVADASHELRTPVAILCGEAEVTLAQTQRTEPEYRESLEILQDEAKRLKHIVEDLFTLARADTGQHPLEFRGFYLDELAAECSRNVRTLASAKQITVSCESPGELPITADEALLRRMMMNLLDNAIKYTPPGGSIALHCGEENGGYRLALEDSGPGIPAELQSRIFERFFRVDKARSRAESDGGGAGLGLSIASWIVQTHGGTLELTRSSPQGSTFTVWLPKAPPSR